MVIKRVRPMSAAKIYGFIGVAMGLVFGAFMSLFGLVAGSMIPSEDGGALAGMLFGVGSIIILPIFYGACSFIGGAIGAVVYNLVAGFVGGLEIETQ